MMDSIYQEIVNDLVSDYGEIISEGKFDTYTELEFEHKRFVLLRKNKYNIYEILRFQPNTFDDSSYIQNLRNTAKKILSKATL
jgi:anti-anti-sigma regulatory factor